MFPILEKYIEQEYKKAGVSIKVPKAVKEKIDKKTKGRVGERGEF